MTISEHALRLRVAILAPTGRDAALTKSILDEAGIESAICPDVTSLERAIEEGTGVLLIAEEAVANGRMHSVATALSRQEPWSDLPVIFLTRIQTDSSTVVRALQTLGNVTLLERPVRPATLVSALRAALKARERQYQVRTHLIEREKTNGALQASEGRLQGIIQQAMVGIAQADLEGRFLLVNPRFCEIVGYTRQELLKLRKQDLTHPQDRVRNAEEFARHIAGHSSFLIEKRYLRKDGRIVWVRNSVAPLLDRDGKPQSIVTVVIDVTEIKQAEERLQFQAQLLDAVGQAAIATDSNGTITYWNHFAETLYGWTATEALGRSIVELVIDPSETQRAAITQWMQAGSSWSQEVLVRHRSGRTFPVFVTDTPLFDATGKLYARIGVSSDITERKQVEEALRDADRRKDEFLATLAHELRNPLAPIRNSLHILRLSGDGDPSTRRVCEMMERQVGHLARLVDDLMEVSRITRGKIELRMEPVELAAVVCSAVEASRPLIDAARHQLAISLPPEPILIRGDPLRLSQVFSNLLNNAAKYMDEGGQICLTARRQDAYVLVTVRDTGIGISADMLPRIFNMFTQVDRSARKAQGGLGIGLTLVRTLVEMHGGQVEAHSQGVNQGCEFVVRLPLSEDTWIAGANSADSPVALATTHRVLVVDDNRDAADSLGMLLRLMGTEVRIVNDGPSALHMMQSYRPSAVLLDIGMPGMDGYEVARRIRQMPEFRDVMLIALTGWGQEDDRRRTTQAGFDHHLLKPADIKTLESLLEAARPGSETKWSGGTQPPSPD